MKCRSTLADTWKEPGLDSRGKADEESVVWEVWAGVSALPRHTERGWLGPIESGYCQVRAKVEVRRHSTTQSSVQSSLPPHS